VARQASSPSLCASVRTVPWADKAEQQLSRLAPSGCQLSADVRIYGAELGKEPGTDLPISILRFKFEVQDKQAAPVSVSLCEQCRVQMRLCNSFPG